jgi:predicted nucleic acid-binding Zn ribbon protein
MKHYKHYSTEIELLKSELKSCQKSLENETNKNKRDMLIVTLFTIITLMVSVGVFLAK